MVRVVLYVPTALYSHIWFSWNKNSYHYTRKNECTPFKEIAAQNATALSAARGGHPGQKTDSLMQRGLVEIVRERLVFCWKSFPLLFFF